MNMFKSLFGPSLKESWQELSRQIGGEFESATFLKSHRVSLPQGNWTIYLDKVRRGKNRVFTRLLAPVATVHEFRFRVYLEHIFTTIGKKLGMQDVEVGYRDFDQQFMIKGNDEGMIRAFFRNDKIREMIVANGRGMLSIEKPFSLGKSFEYLHYQESGICRDVPRLKTLFELMALSLNHLSEIRAIRDTDPRSSY